MAFAFEAVFVLAVSSFKVVCGADVCFLFSVDFDGGFQQAPCTGHWVFTRQLQEASLGVWVLDSTFLMCVWIIARMFFVQLYDSFVVFFVAYAVECGPG